MCDSEMPASPLRKSASLGIKESLQAPNRHCAQNTSGASVASCRHRAERAISRCSIWQSTANYVAATSLH
jgi:hypothetical protein